MLKDSFGYLPVEQCFHLSFGSIAPIPEIRDVIAEMKNECNRDGYLYPHTEYRTTSTDGGKTFGKVPKSERPGLLHHLPLTHDIELPDHLDQGDLARYALVGFVAHMLGNLYGHRIQFNNWTIDGRVPLNGSSDHSAPTIPDATYCLEKATATWLGWPKRQQIVALNVLFLKPRTQIYEFEWDRFFAEYQVFDALTAVQERPG